MNKLFTSIILFSFLALFSHATNHHAIGLPWHKQNNSFVSHTFDAVVSLSSNAEIQYNKKTLDGQSFCFNEIFLGADQHAIVGLNEFQTSSFKGSDSSNWKCDKQAWRSIDLGMVYPKIQIELRAYQNNVEKIFTLSPGANPNNIRIEITNAKDISINAQGELQLKNTLGEMRFTKPIAYQIIQNKKIMVEVEYVLNANSYGFSLGDYHQEYDLVIDPLIASTFLGTAGHEKGYALQLDSQGNVFVVGYTESLDFPVSNGAVDETHNGDKDIFVAKFNNDLSSLLAATYIGGGAVDGGYSLFIDSDDQIYITGNTASANFPTTSEAYDQSHNGAWDVFVCKLNNDLNMLISSTYVGGSEADAPLGIELDVDNNVFVAGYSMSTDFPTTANSYETNNSGNSDAFVIKLSSDLSQLTGMSYLGGEGDDYAFSMSINNNGEVFIAGETASSSFPVILPAYDNTRGGATDGFIAKFNNDLSSLQQSTYFGGGFFDNIWGIDIDEQDFVFVTGYTQSADFPTTANAFDESFNGGSDAFVSKLTNDLQSLSASTLIGGSGTERANELAIDNEGNVFITGYVWSEDFPTHQTAYDDSYNGFDIFISNFSSDLSLLNASTYLGGAENAGDEQGWGLAFDEDNNVYVGGYSYSEDFPTTLNAYDQTFDGSSYNAEVIISKFDNGLNADISSAPELLLENTIVLYPNPTKDMVYIQSQKKYSLQITNSLGQVVLSIASLNNNSIDLSAMEKGIYFLRFFNEEESILKKLNIE